VGTRAGPIEVGKTRGLATGSAISKSHSTLSPRAVRATTHANQGRSWSSGPEAPISDVAPTFASYRRPRSAGAAAEIVGHGTSGVPDELTSEEAGDQWPQVTVAEAMRNVSEVADGLKQSQNARITQA
jgi:hypothetical protein